MRQPLIMGNWKMNGLRQDGLNLAQALVNGLGETTNQIVVCVPYVYLSDIAAVVTGSSIAVGAQNVADQASGAYTGEVSANMLADIQCHYALVGHSERRSYYGDSDQMVAKRFCQAIQANIIPVLCVGETLEERERSLAALTRNNIDELTSKIIDSENFRAKLFSEAQDLQFELNHMQLECENHYTSSFEIIRDRLGQFIKNLNCIFTLRKVGKKRPC
jgi:triosephosphate isomerase